MGINNGVLLQFGKTNNTGSGGHCIGTYPIAFNSIYTVQIATIPTDSNTTVGGALNLSGDYKNNLTQLYVCKNIWVNQYVGMTSCYIAIGI